MTRHPEITVEVTGNRFMIMRAVAIELRMRVGKAACREYCDAANAAPDLDEVIALTRTWVTVDC